MKKGSLRQSINATFYNGLSDIVLKSLTTGPLLTAYVFSFGLGTFALGVLQALYSLASLLHLPISFLLGRGVSPKKLACSFAVTAHLFLILVGCSFFLKASGLASILFMGAYTVFFLMLGMIGGAFWPWCKKIVPRGLLTSFFAHRIKYILLVKIITVTLATALLAFLTEYRIDQTDRIYGGLIFLAVIAGGIYVCTLFRMPALSLKDGTDMPFMSKLRLALGHKSFVAFFLRFGLANFAFAFFTPFTMAFLLKGLHLPMTTALVTSLAGSLIDIFSVDFWKGDIYRRGIAKSLSRSFLILLSAGVLLTGLTLFQIPVWFGLIPAFVLIGIGNSGINLGISDSVISHVPEESASLYISVLNIARFGFSGAATFLGGLVLSVADRFSPYTVFLCICTGLFGIAGLIVRRLKPITPA